MPANKHHSKKAAASTSKRNKASTTSAAAVADNSADNSSAGNSPHHRPSKAPANSNAAANASMMAAATANASSNAAKANVVEKLVADHTAEPPVCHEAQIKGTTNMKSHEVPHYGNVDNNDFNPQMCLKARRGSADLNVKHLHSRDGSSSWRREESAADCDDAHGDKVDTICSPLADYKISDFTSVVPHEFHPRTDQPMMGRGGCGWTSEIDGTTTTTAATPEKGTARKL